MIWSALTSWQMNILYLYPTKMPNEITNYNENGSEFFFFSFSLKEKVVHPQRWKHYALFTFFSKSLSKCCSWQANKLECKGDGCLSWVQRQKCPVLCAGRGQWWKCFKCGVVRKLRVQLPLMVPTVLQSVRRNLFGISVQQQSSVSALRAEREDKIRRQS